MQARFHFDQDAFFVSAVCRVFEYNVSVSNDKFIVRQDVLEFDSDVSGGPVEEHQSDESCRVPEKPCACCVVRICRTIYIVFEKTFLRSHS